ncbi:MAG: VOC family protein [Cellvibrionaceae bacterium]
MKIKPVLLIATLLTSSAFLSLSVFAGENKNYLAATAVNVKDLASSTEFYKQVFGYSIKQSYNTVSMDENILTSASGKGSSIVLVQYKNKDNSNNGSTRLVFYVSDAKSTITSALKMGATIVREAKPLGSGSTVMGIVKDLDGYAVEVIQR